MTSDVKENPFMPKAECIVTLLASGGKNYVGEDLQSMYQRWTNLTVESKRILDKGMEDILDGSKISLYYVVIKSFKIWDTVQTQKGAPGWSGSAYSDQATDVEIFHLLHTMDLVWRLKLKDGDPKAQAKKASTAATIKTKANYVGSRSIFPFHTLTEEGDSDLEKLVSPLGSGDET